MNKGFIDVSDHPLSVMLNKNYLKILKEFNHLTKFFPLRNKPNNLMGSVIDQKQSNGKNLYEGKILSIFTRIAVESCSESEKKIIWGDTLKTKETAEKIFLEKQKLTPVLESIILPYKDYVGTVGFNMMEPGAKLSMHYGMISKYIRFHLGLICDPEAKFYIDNCIPRAWIEGKVWAFDDGERFHGTEHNGTKNRLILLIDIDKKIFPSIEKEKK